MSKTMSVAWAKRVERWKDRGLSGKAFAAQTQLNLDALSRDGQPTTVGWHRSTDSNMLRAWSIPPVAASKCT